MQGSLKVKLDFIDGRPSEFDEIPGEYPAGKETTACVQLLASINAMGGIMHFIDGGITFVPLCTLKLLTITAPTVQLASASDLPSGSLLVRP